MSDAAVMCLIFVLKITWGQARKSPVKYKILPKVQMKLQRLTFFFLMGYLNASEVLMI